MFGGSLPKAELIPSSFLPHLPKQKYSLEPLSTPILLAHIALLRELYIPPIHGGFQASDVGRDSDVQVKRRSVVRERRFSAGLVDTMDSLGLGLDLELESGESGAPKVDAAIIERDDESEDEEDDYEYEVEGEYEDEDEVEAVKPHLDPFEREWSEKWLNGVVKRAQGWIEEHDEPEGDDLDTFKEMETILRDSTAVLAMMAGTSAAGSLTRHLLFPVHPSLAAGVRALQRAFPMDATASPTTAQFLATLAASPVTPSLIPRPITHSPDRPRAGSSPTSGRKRRPTLKSNDGRPNDPSRSPRRRRNEAVPVLLHDAPMQDHISVGVQTWGSAILLGREMALSPSDFGLFPGPSTPSDRGVRVLELGAGTGLLGILCRKLLDLRMYSEDVPEPKFDGLVVATDFHHDVLANLKVCVDLNFPPGLGPDATAAEQDLSTGLHLAKLDWTTFPSFMERGENKEDCADIAPFVKTPFDLVLASDCVYDPTHAKMLREVGGWVLRLPDESIPGDIGGTFHLLSPIRPTFTPELESIDVNFPTLSSYTPLADRQAAAKSGNTAPELRGEGLGLAKGLRLGVRGSGKRSVKGRKGEGRVDEVAGYWWWEVGWG